ncbi:MAG: hypothetical protein ACRD3F_02930 [Acidobacteriaceae bacterium]
MGGLEHFGINLLTVLFFAGLAGSVLVILISFAEDLTELFGKELPSGIPDETSSAMPH